MEMETLAKSQECTEQAPPTSAPPANQGVITAPSIPSDGTVSKDDSGQYHDHQAAVLPHKKLMIVFPVLALAQFTAYLDQTSISAAVPVIGDSLSLGASLSWVANSYMLATTAVQLVGHLSPP